METFKKIMRIVLLGIWIFGVISLIIGGIAFFLTLVLVFIAHKVTLESLFLEVAGIGLLLVGKMFLSGAIKGEQNFL